MERKSTANGPRLLDQVRELIRIRHYILYHGKRHPRDMGEELTAFLSHLASQRNVAASTQNQARNAILFLYRGVLKIKLPWLDDVQRAKKPQRLPVVLTARKCEPFGEVSALEQLSRMLLAAGTAPDSSETALLRAMGSRGLEELPLETASCI